MEMGTMPTDKDFKRRVRARMARTGESYTAARAQLLRRGSRTGRGPQQGASDGAGRSTTAGGPASASPPSGDLATIAGIRDATVRDRTGRDWAGWVAVLDAVDAASWPHKDIARHLVDEHGLGPWWSQSVTGGYERLKGLREANQRRDGSYDVNRSRTLPVPVSRLYQAFGARERKRWLGDVDVRVRTARVDRSMRLVWSDGSRLDLHFWDKGPDKSQVQLQHRGLPDRATADRLRAAWGEHLDALRAYLKG